MGGEDSFFLQGEKLAKEVIWEQRQEELRKAKGTAGAKGLGWGWGQVPPSQSPGSSMGQLWQQLSPGQQELFSLSSQRFVQFFVQDAHGPSPAGQYQGARLTMEQPGLVL